MEGLELPGGRKADVAPAGGAASDFEMALARPLADIPEPPDVTPKSATTSTSTKTATRSKAPKSTAPKNTAPKPAEVIKDDYSQDAQELVSGLWTVAAAVPLDLTQSLAFVINNNGTSLAAALAAGAKHNSMIRKTLVSSGEAGWMLQLGTVAVSMGLQTMQILRDPEIRRQCAEQTREQLRIAMAMNEESSDAGIGNV